MTAIDERPDALTAADWFDAGYRAAEADMAQAWAVLARRIQRDASRISGPVAEPVARPQSDDSIWFTAAEWAVWAGGA